MISVRNVKKSYSSMKALDDVSFDVEPGQVTGFLGPNGAGKTTLMKIMLALEVSDTGSVLFDGIAYADLKNPLAIVGAAIDASWINPKRTARDHLRVIGLTQGINADRVDENLKLVGLGGVANRRIGEFSLGMRQRLSLAAALLGKPQHLVLDEPVNGLDPDGITWLRGFLASYADKGYTVFLSSHLISEMSLIADRVVVIGRGKILADGETKSLLSNTQRKVRVSSLDNDVLREALVAAGGDVKVERSALVVQGLSALDVGQIALGHGVALRELAEEQGSLEDVYYELTSGSEMFKAVGAP